MDSNVNSDNNVIKFFLKVFLFENFYLGNISRVRRIKISKDFNSFLDAWCIMPVLVLKWYKRKGVGQGVQTFAWWCRFVSSSTGSCDVYEPSAQLRFNLKENKAFQGEGFK